MAGTIGYMAAQAGLWIALHSGSAACQLAINTRVRKVPAYWHLGLGRVKCNCASTWFTLAIVSSLSGVGGGVEGGHTDAGHPTPYNLCGRSDWRRGNCRRDRCCALQCSGAKRQPGKQKSVQQERNDCSCMQYGDKLNLELMVLALVDLFEFCNAGPILGECLVMLIHVGRKTE